MVNSGIKYEHLGCESVFPGFVPGTLVADAGKTGVGLGAVNGKRKIEELRAPGGKRRWTRF
jgi:hypothetical protein